MVQQPIVGRCTTCEGLLTAATGRALQDPDTWAELGEDMRGGGMVVETMSIETVRLLPFCACKPVEPDAGDEA